LQEPGTDPARHCHHRPFERWRAGAQALGWSIMQFRLAGARP